jgi:hypothetical protein
MAKQDNSNDGELFQGDGNQTLVEMKKKMGASNKVTKGGADCYRENGQFNDFWKPVQDEQPGWNR